MNKSDVLPTLGNLRVTSTPTRKDKKFDDMIVGPTISKIKDYPEHSTIEAEGAADDDFAEMQNYQEPIEPVILTGEN